jgi:hypothetical protein
MREKFNLPQYKAVNYRLNPETGYYYTNSEFQPDKTPVMRLPDELKVTPTQGEKIKCYAGELIVSRQRSTIGNYKFITGLKETGFQNWYLRNDYEFINGAKVINLILFHFREENSQLTVYYFSRYDKGSTEQRLRFVSGANPQLLKPLMA